MKELRIKISEEDWERLQRVAEQMNSSVEELVSRLLPVLLQRISPPSEDSQKRVEAFRDWEQRLDALLQRVHRHSSKYTPEEIEADITTTREEYRQIMGQWHALLGGLMQELGIDPSEIETDITAAYEEYRSQCVP
ncbi:MAG: hypothetical protein N2045_03360 [Fimbriimonadales bacterium]|jgi:hypothetical protein|nr:hypothetical protein [Fimbriimonadales bacterium]